MRILRGKKYIIYVALAIVFLTPGLLAAMFYVFSDNVSDTNRDIALEIVDSRGKVHSFENTDDISILFHDIVDDNKKTLHKDGLLSFKETDAFKVTLVKDGKKTSYDFFFDRTSPSSCLFRDEGGTVYKLDAGKAIEFMDSVYASALYPHSSVPQLTLNNVAALPMQSTWEYYSYSSVRHAVDNDTSSSPTSVGMSFLDFDISFTKSPDRLTVEVKDSLGMEFFSGSYAEFVMSGMFSRITESGKYTCVVHAVWDDIGSDCCGSATYYFDLSVDFDPPGIFWLSADSVECGGFVVLSGKNIIDKDSIVVSAIPSLNYEPIFFEDGEYIRALLPINIKNGRDEIIYQIKVSYDGISCDLTLKTTPSRASSSIKSYGAGKIDIALRERDVLDAFADFVTSGKYEDTVYRNPVFIAPSPGDIRATFGDTVRNTKSNNDNFISGGMSFVRYGTAKIQACLTGMVVNVGKTEYGANTVVIDHGLGLRSVYYCVSNALVHEGTVVSAGDIIAEGCSGEGVGLTDGITVYIELWVGNVPVSYRPLLEDGVQFGIDFGTEPAVGENN